MKKNLTGLKPEDISHIKDQTALDRMNKVPGFKKLVQHTVGTVMEKYAAVEYSGNGLSITPISYPQLNTMLVEAKKILDVKDSIALSTEWNYRINSFTVGEQNKRIVLPTGSIDLLNDDELMFVLGHELGHIKCNHITYQMLTEGMFMPLQDSTLKIVFTVVKSSLLDWYRISDFTADRAGLLCCQDLKQALSTMIKMAGLPKSCYNQINTEGFIQQARQFKKESDVLDKIVKYFSVNSAFHPWLVLRAAELIDWYESGEYNRIINKYSKSVLTFKF
jgi:Zn-dependent protease with chaperone function